MKISLSYVDNGAIFDEDIEFENVKKLRLLCELFKDVNILHTFTSDRGRLALAVLRNKLESTPLAMLIDELQTTEEFIQQSKHHPKYMDMWNLLIEIGRTLRGHIYIKDERTLRIVIGRLLAPCKKCMATGFVEKIGEVPSFSMQCPECIEGYEKDLFSGSTPKKE